VTDWPSNEAAKKKEKRGGGGLKGIGEKRTKKKLGEKNASAVEKNIT